MSAEGICDIDGSGASAAVVGPLSMLTGIGCSGLLSVVAAIVVVEIVVEPSAGSSYINVSSMEEVVPAKTPWVSH